MFEGWYLLCFGSFICVQFRNCILHNLTIYFSNLWVKLCSVGGMSENAHIDLVAHDVPTAPIFDIVLILFSGRLLLCFGSFVSVQLLSYILHNLTIYFSLRNICIFFFFFLSASLPLIMYVSYCGDREGFGVHHISEINQKIDHMIYCKVVKLLIVLYKYTI